MTYGDLNLKSYSPYSGKNEACLIEGKSGLLYPGVRIENLSYPLTISSIQAAICSCLANGDTPLTYYSNLPDPELLEWWASSFHLKIRDTLPESGRVFNPFLEPAVIHPVSETLFRLTEDAVTVHSDFPVSALILSDSGYISGVNVEVPAWSLGLCAERVAIARALSHGVSHFHEIKICAPKSEFCSPCGACRQVLSEFMAESTAELHHSNSALSSHNITDLLPYSIITYALRKQL